MSFHIENRPLFQILHYKFLWTSITKPLDLISRGFRKGLPRQLSNKEVKWSEMKLLSCVQLFATPWTVAYQPFHPWDFPGKSTGVGCHFLLHSSKESAPYCRRCRFDTRVGKIPWRRKWQPTPAFLPGESHGQRILWATVHGVSRVIRYDLATNNRLQENY